jgi:hypothetical protein
MISELGYKADSLHKVTIEAEKPPPNSLGVQLSLNPEPSKGGKLQLQRPRNSRPHLLSEAKIGHVGTDASQTAQPNQFRPISNNAKCGIA